MNAKLKFICLLAAIGFCSSAIAQETNDVERAVDGAVEEAVRDIERSAQALDGLERQLRVCRTAQGMANWVEFVETVVANDPTLGTKSDQMLVCIAYSTGRRDQLLEERERLQSR